MQCDILKAFSEKMHSHMMCVHNGIEAARKDIEEKAPTKMYFEAANILNFVAKLDETQAI
jgi:hypothetical protein